MAPCRPESKAPSPSNLTTRPSVCPGAPSPPRAFKMPAQLNFSLPSPRPASLSPHFLHYVLPPPAPFTAQTPNSSLFRHCLLQKAFLSPVTSLHSVFFFFLNTDAKKTFIISYCTYRLESSPMVRIVSILLHAIFLSTMIGL